MEATSAGDCRSNGGVILTIDASNIRVGGGLTHLVEMLRAADPASHGVSKVHLWASSATLAHVDERDWLQKRSDPLLDRGRLRRMVWQRFRLRKLASDAGSDLLFVPGGVDASGVRPMVTMSQNLLPFEWSEARRFGWSTMTVKCLLLRLAHKRTFREAIGVIFLTNYARDAVLKVTGELSGAAAVVPHGINPRFQLAPRAQEEFSTFSTARPCRVLYVSVVEVYKHHWHVADAVAALRAEGIPIVLDLVGPPASGSARLAEALDRLDPSGQFIRHVGEVPYPRLHELYAQADVFVFASSCETFGQILTEAMSAGLPIACSNRSAMPEILSDAGVYFDPESPAEIASALRQLMESATTRTGKAEMAYRRARAFSWRRCADETFAFFARAVDEKRVRVE